MPPAVSDLCHNLPPPMSFNGPFVIVDKLMELFAKAQIPEMDGEKRERSNSNALMWI